MKNNENPFSRRPRNGTMEIANNEVGRRKMAAERVVGAGPPARPEVYARLEDNRVFSFSLLCTVATRCDSLRLVTPPPSSREYTTWLIFTASCVSQPKKNEVFFPFTT